MRPLCFALLLAARLLPAANAGLPDFLPSDTKVMIGMRLRAIVESSLFQQAASQAVSASSDWMSVASMIGFNPLKDIDEILIASPADRQNAPVLVVVRGRFDVARLSANAKHYHGVPLLSGAKGPNNMVALLDASTAIAGDTTAVHNAIDRRAKNGPLPEPLARQVENLREHYDIWGTGQVPQGALPPEAQNSGLGSLDRFEFGLTLSHGLEASAQLQAHSAKDLEKVAASLQFFKAAMAAQTNQSAAGVKLETHVEGNKLKLSLKVPEEELRKAMVARATAIPRPAAFGGLATFSGPAAPATAPRQAPSQVKDANGDTVLLTLPGRR